ncbi:DUF3613 domain-containing protein [Denitrificimonas sp. JX-1]|uniref:DUF3613 domain-containing protein n=1 Tax=Denitrificimonas halotolerans TaxID=3098930 RepID=A0ABU5GSP1_9GAMM|nr:DUF3613 domain-containing protein [Denitrificimonas sp. JX-1]MDY7219527.1 DUF3613 domain-containing protein [Denitrificimonas sp. JX-1]
MKYNTVLAMATLIIAAPVAAQGYYDHYQGHERMRKERTMSAHSQANVWLEAQRDGRYASKHIQNATPAEYEMSLKRWSESYKHPIPEYFDQESAGEFTTD